MKYTSAGRCVSAARESPRTSQLRLPRSTSAGLPAGMNSLESSNRTADTFKIGYFVDAVVLSEVQDAWVSELTQNLPKFWVL